MKLPYRRGASALILALLNAPALAQTEPGSGAIDTLVPADDQATAPLTTGDPKQDRINRLEARIRELEQKLEFATGRIEKVENRSAKAAQPGLVPIYSDPTGTFSFKVRGVLQADYAAFNEREGGYDYNNGTAFRRARIGLEGTAFKDFNWRLETDFAGNSVTLTDAYLQYNGLQPFTITLGQHKAPFGLEANNSDSVNVFLERGMFVNAASGLGAERRIGLSAAYAKDNFTATFGLFGENESIGRVASTDVSTPDEGWGFNGRVTWEPIFDTGRIVHVGAGSHWRKALRSASGAGARLSDRPNIRVDNGNIIDTGTIEDADEALYYGVEAAAVFGPLTLASEYGRVRLERTTAGAPDPEFDGFYVFATYFLTGETRPFRSGNFDRIRPIHNFDGKGGWGAWEFALRYDDADLSETPVTSSAGNEAHSWTAGLNWYLNPNIKLQFNYIRFEGDNTPLDPVGTRTKGEAFAARAHIDW